MASMNGGQVLLTEAEVSKQLRVSLAALRKWRVMNRGPQFLKIGSLVRYRQNDVDDWLASVPVGGGLNQRNGHPGGHVGAAANGTSNAELEGFSRADGLAASHRSGYRVSSGQPED
jgi:predicted DNA-binding transcriptional regulator AlpA